MKRPLATTAATRATATTNSTTERSMKTRTTKTTRLGLIGAAIGALLAVADGDAHGQTWTVDGNVASTSVHTGTGLNYTLLRLQVRCAGNLPNVETVIGRLDIGGRPDVGSVTTEFRWSDGSRTTATGAASSSPGQARVTFGPAEARRLIPKLLAASQVSTRAVNAPASTAVLRWSLRGSGNAIRSLRCVR